MPAVGNCVAIVGIYVNLIVGLAVGPNAVLANRIGQNRRNEISSTVHTVMTFGGMIGLAFMIIGMPFIVGYNFGASILRSYGDTKRPMYYLLASGITNVILNLVLVICFRLGVAGVAIATTISNLLSVSLVMIHLQC